VVTSPPEMHQNSPTAIVDLKNFPGSQFLGAYAAGGGGEGKGRDGRWVGGEGGEREEGGWKEGGVGWRPPL